MTFTTSIEETGVSRNTTLKKTTSYVSTTINNRTILAEIKKNLITGTDSEALARSVRNSMGAHPACTRKIEEILIKLIERGLVIHRDSVAHVATLEERAAAKDNHQKSKSKVHKTKRRPVLQLLPAIAEQHADTIAHQPDEDEIYIPASWSEFGPDTPPWDTQLIASCLPGVRVSA